MIHKKILCDRCNKVIFDSKRKSEIKASELVSTLFGIKSDQNLGYAEINFTTSDGVVKNTIHLCEKCYDIVINVLNSKHN